MIWLDWDGLIERLSRLVDLEASARASGAFRRRRQVGSAAVLLRLCFAYVLGGLSLRLLSAWAEERGVACLSDVAVLKRLRASAEWIGALVTALLEERLAAAGIGAASARLVAVDATMVVPPGGKKDYWLVHTVFDLNALRLSAVEVSDRHERERLARGGVAPGEIRVADRLYAQAEELAAVRRDGGEFLVRAASTHPRLLDAEGRRLDRLALCREAAASGLVERSVVVASAKTKTEVAARLLIVPLPKLVAEKARAVARRKAARWGYRAGEVGIEMAGYLMLLTSLPADAWPPDKVLSAYRLRWQVELAFKRMKSIVGLERLRARAPDLARLWINVALLASLLAEDELPAVTEALPVSLPRAA